MINFFKRTHFALIADFRRIKIFKIFKMVYNEGQTMRNNLVTIRNNIKAIRRSNMHMQYIDYEGVKT